jgi:predicted MFS family arabinose efflux permease
MLAGLLIDLLPGRGIATCFLLNGLSYIAVIYGYSRMQLPPHSPPTNPSAVWDGMRAAINFVRAEPAVRRIILLVACFSLLVFPFATLFPVFARETLQGDARLYGLLGTANGTGALLGALTLAFMGHRVPQRRQFVGGLLGFCIAVTGFALSTQRALSLALLVVVGWCFIVALATANTAVQHRIPDHLRGSVMGIYTLAFLGTGPLGSLLLGTLARFWGAPQAVACGSLLCLLIALLMARRTLQSAT